MAVFIGPIAVYYALAFGRIPDDVVNNSVHQRNMVRVHRDNQFSGWGSPISHFWPANNWNVGPAVLQHVITETMRHFRAAIFSQCVEHVLVRMAGGNCGGANEAKFVGESVTSGFTPAIVNLHLQAHGAQHSIKPLAQTGFTA